jgi:Sulfotransferase family
MDASVPPMPRAQSADSAASAAESQPSADADGGEIARGRVPDFFIVGHQKSGTTALWEMLRRHPQIFMPRVKEPRYFAFDLRSPIQEPSVLYRQTFEGYQRLYAPAPASQLVGDASPQYLRSRVAAREIARVQPGARIVAILREPASFLRSFHMQSVENHVETERDLAKALALEADRREGRSVPRNCHHPQDLLYLDHARYVEQLSRYHEAFGSEQVLVVIYDDFQRDNVGTVRAVLRFLKLDDQVAIEQRQTKPLKRVRSARLHRLTGALAGAVRNPAASGPLARTVVALTPKPLRRGRSAALLRSAAYASAGAQEEPDKQLMLELRRRVKPEVVALSEYLDRDLVSLWGYDRVG